MIGSLEESTSASRNLKLTFLVNLIIGNFLNGGDAFLRCGSQCIIQHKKISVFLENLTEFLNPIFTLMVYVRVL